MDANVSNADFKAQWQQLTPKEKNYAYYIYKASWAGAKMVFHDISYEAPAIFLIL
jgi:hypothetical protein